MFSLFYCLHAKVQMHLGVVTILISSVFRSAALDRGEALIRGKRIFRCEYPKMQRLLEGGGYDISIYTIFPSTKN